MKCRVCKLEKELDAFSWANKKENIKNNRCKACQKIAAQAHYLKYKQGYSERTEKRRNIIREFKFNYLKTHPCIDCNESDPVVLEFDHVNGKTKKFNIGSTNKLGHTIETLQIEIDKCVVRCSNCHKKKTAKEANWYKNKQ